MLLFYPFQLAAAFVADLVIGDPHWLPHPIRWIGRLILRLESFCYKADSSPAGQRLGGFIMWLMVLAAVILATVGLLEISRVIAAWLSCAVAVWLAFTTLAVHSLHAESRKVMDALERGSIDEARQHLSGIVSRDTAKMTEPDIIRAVLETVAENISDGIVAPLFYLGLGGPIAAMGYKAVNTMDSMVGYENDRYRYFGWFAAKADDFFNWVPARLTGLMIVASAFWGGLDPKRAWRVMWRDAGKIKSPNAGFPESAAAGALGIQFGGENVYFGRAIVKPRLGDSLEPLDVHHYYKLVRLMYITSGFMLGLAMVLRWLLISM